MKQLMILLATIAITFQDAHAQTVSITSCSSAAAPSLLIISQDADSVIFMAWDSDHRHQQVFFRYSEQEEWHEGSVSPISMHFTTEIRVKNASVLYWQICSGNTEIQECVEGYVKVATDSVDAEQPHHHPSW